MPYHVVLVRLGGGSKPYPVNGGEWWGDGEQVLVQLNWPTKKELVVGEVAGRSFSKKPCRHSIVCEASRAITFGEGPSAISTKPELIRYMTEHCGFREIEAAFLDGFDRPIEPAPWKVAYISAYPIHDPDSRYIQSSGRIILIGESNVGVHEPSHHGRLFIEHREGVVLFRYYNRIQSLRHGEGNPFSYAADWLFDDFTVPVEDPRHWSNEYIPFDFDG